MYNNEDDNTENSNTPPPQGWEQGSQFTANTTGAAPPPPQGWEQGSQFTANTTGAAPPPPQGWEQSPQYAPYTASAVPPPQGWEQSPQYAPYTPGAAPPPQGWEQSPQYTPHTASAAPPPQNREQWPQYAPYTATPPQQGWEQSSQFTPNTAGATPPPQGWEQTPQFTQGSANDIQRTGAPMERSDAPSPTEAPTMSQAFSARLRENQGERVYTTGAENWSEPAYTAPQESTSTMYTPGIPVNPPYPHKHAAEASPKHKDRQHKGGAGRFIRAACLVVVCVLLSGAAVYGVMEYRITRGDFASVNQVVLGGSSASTQPSGSVTAPVSTTGSGMSAEDIYDIACKQVVDIRTEMPVSDSMNVFGMPGSSSGSDSGTTTAVSGSGFIISNDGYILTNYHVIQTAYENSLPLKVSLHDSSTYDATVVGYDASNDVALIKIDATGLSPAVISDSSAVRVGERVYAVGNPFGDLNYTMTEGIVSALERVVTVDGKSIDTFQFDAAVNPGNSGGPVYNTNGEVIGIVSVKIMGNSVEGIGFAIPINDAIVIASELIQNGYITGRPLIGISVETVTSAHAEYYGWVVGAYVKSVTAGSAADKAGLKVGDIITALGTDTVTTSDELIYTLRKFNAGDSTTITIWRSGDEITLPITFDENLTAGQPQKP